MLAAKLLSGIGGEEKLYVDEVFQTVTRTGTGATATVTTGFQPDLVWSKARSGTNGTAYHSLIDSARGVGYDLYSNATSAQAYLSDTITAFGPSGYSLGSDATGSRVNAASTEYVNWVFRRAPKFFDCGTYIGNGVDGRQIPHALGCDVGMVIVKRTDITGEWLVYHRSVTASAVLVLNNTNSAYTSSGYFNTPSSAYFSVQAHPGLNATGGTYVWYAFAHDTSTDGIIQCGSFTTDGSGNATVTLGWEPQCVLGKNIDTAQNWFINDVMRGMPVDSNSNLLFPNTSGAEASSNFTRPTATGFTARTSASRTFIYLAIRRSNKPPTTGTQVYNAIARTGTGAAATVTGVGFAPDLVIDADRNRTFTNYTPFTDRLRGVGNLLASNTSASEVSAPNSITAFGMDGFSVGTDTYINGTVPYINWCLKRAPEVFDVVCYAGTGSATTVAHNLGVVPELIISKVRSDAGYNWFVYVSALGLSSYLMLDQTNAVGTFSSFWGSGHTASSFSLGSANNNNALNKTNVAYLFATKPNISKVGSYTGNGTSQTIDCGFTTGCRFFMCKRTGAAGDWYVWDSARGIIASNDPHLSLNTTAAEVTTDDSVDPNVLGIDILQNSATNINVNGATYIYLSIA